MYASKRTQKGKILSVIGGGGLNWEKSLKRRKARNGEHVHENTKVPDEDKTCLGRGNTAR